MSKISEKYNDGHGSKWNCLDCEYISGHLGTLKRHVESRHICVNCACPYCDQQFNSLRSLQTHKNKYHKLQ